MTVAASGLAARAVELREDFDRAFADPIRLDASANVALLAIRVGEQPMALRLSEIAGLFADKTVTCVPGSHPAMRGIAGFRGNILPVYDLHALLGLPIAQAPRWLVITAGAPVALAFEAFSGQLRVPEAAVLPQTGQRGAADHAREFVRTPDFAGPILHLPSVLASIRSFNASTTPKQE
jgi:purine-binding chemotaxis protein CheW